LKEFMFGDWKPFSSVQPSQRSQIVVLLLFVWYEHYKFFRRYGLWDVPTIWLNSVLLFLVLFYVYPLKFLFTLWMNQLFGFGENEMIEASQVPLLMLIYSAGFVAIQLVFVLMYLRAYSLRGALGLGSYELSVTREEIQGYLLNVSVGLASIAIAVFGSAGVVSLAGYIYLLVFPLQTINGRVMGSRRSRDEGARTAARADDENGRT
jgi:hypothetical protein